jgi:hypothetical protein
VDWKVPVVTLAAILLILYSYLRILEILRALRYYERADSKGRALEPLAVVHRMRSDLAIIAYSDYLRAAADLRARVKAGKAKGSTSEIDIQVDSLRFVAVQNLLVRRHPVVLLGLAALCIPLGALPAILFLAIAYVQFHSADRLESQVRERRSQPAPSADGAGELRSLGELRRAGILTEEEFQTAKARLPKPVEKLPVKPESKKAS